MQVHLKQPVDYKKGNAIPLATPYNHLEGGLGMAQRLPMFAKRPRAPTVRASPRTTTVRAKW